MSETPNERVHRAELDEGTALLVLSYATEELRSLALDGSEPLVSVEEARQTLAQLMERMGVRHNIEADKLVDESRSGDTARRVVDLLRADPAVGGLVDDLIEHPPENQQMSVEVAIATAVILGALVTWLQTKISLKVQRTPKGTVIDFELLKGSADKETVDSVVKASARALGLGG